MHKKTPNKLIYMRRAILYEEELIICQIKSKYMICYNV